MDRPRHGFNRNGSHNADKYVCDCGYDECDQADYEYAIWAEAELSKYRAFVDDVKAIDFDCADWCGKSPTKGIPNLCDGCEITALLTKHGIHGGGDEH